MFRDNVRVWTADVLRWRHVSGGQVSYILPLPSVYAPCSREVGFNGGDEVYEMINTSSRRSDGCDSDRPTDNLITCRTAKYRPILEFPVSRSLDERISSVYTQKTEQRDVNTIRKISKCKTNAIQ